MDRSGHARDARATSGGHTDAAAYAGARLRRAASLAASGMLASARRDARAALAEAPDDALVLTVAGIVLFTTRDYSEALEALARAAACGAGPRVHWLRRERAVRLGWDRDAIAALRDGAAAEPEEPRWHAALLALHARRRSWDAALRDGAALARLAPDAPSWWMELAVVHAARGEVEHVARCIERALARTTSIPFRLEAARLLRSVGEFDAARTQLRAVLARDATDADAHLALAELALWSGDRSATEAHARAALATGSSPGVERLLGTIDVLEGRTDAALARFSAAVAADPGEAEAHAWLAEIAIRRARYADAHESISRAIAAAGGALFPGHVLRLRVKIEEALPIGDLLDRHLITHLIPPLRALCPEHEPTFSIPDREAWRALLDTALARMHGNRSSVATWLDRGTLRLVPDVRDPRAESRRVLERVRVDEPESLLAELDALVGAFPESPLPLAHQGELLAWLGRYDEARAALEAAIAKVRGTRWAYVGLSAIDMVTGDPARALETSAEGVSVMTNTVGPAVYVHRGEALRRLGRLADAEEDLRRAVAVNPSRLGGWLNLALLRLAQGDVERASTATAEAFELAPGLLSDAAREIDVELFGDLGGSPDGSSLERVLSRALDMTRANRSSSCVTYFTADGALRFGRNTARDAEPLHARNGDELTLAMGLLERGLGALPRPGNRPRSSANSSSRITASAASEPSPARAPTLGTAELEHFLEHGYVRLEACLSRDVVDAWKERVRARVSRAPERWMRYDESRARAATFGEFEDPASWPADSISLVGDRVVPVASVSERLWGAVCDLVGERALATRDLGDHVILRIPWSTELPREMWRTGWHVDDPSRAMRIDGLVNGLVAFVLLSDVAPDGGPSVLAPASVGHVARALAARPEGVDMVDRALGESIARRCSRFVECTGRAGDVYLAHPLMVHCGTLNVGTTLRWMANPNFLLRAPLDVRGPARSPVAEAIARALSRGDDA